MEYFNYLERTEIIGTNGKACICWKLLWINFKTKIFQGYKYPSPEWYSAKFKILFTNFEYYLAPKLKWYFMKRNCHTIQRGKKKYKHAPRQGLSYEVNAPIDLVRWVKKFPEIKYTNVEQISFVKVTFYLYFCFWAPWYTRSIFYRTRAINRRSRLVAAPLRL